MVSSATSPLMKFNFEGQFLGFVSDDGVLKYMRLKVLSEEVHVKLPQAMRLAFGSVLQPGEPIWVTGIGSFDRHAHAIKLKATQIIPLTERPSMAAPTATAEPLPVVAPATKSNLKSQPKVKILMCQKSGCLKRGGKGLYEALGQAICDRSLEQHITIERTGCLKCCSSAPSLVVMPKNRRYKDVHVKTLPKIIDEIAQSLAIDRSGQT